MRFKKRILFIGIPDMAFACLNACNKAGVNIVGVMGPKPDHSSYNEFKKFVKMRGLNFIEYTDLKSPHLIQTIKDLDIDMAVVSSFNYKIPAILLDAVKDGFINLHPSLLPLYRGANPYSRVILNDEKETGVTLHYMNEEFDCGNIILQKRCPIEPNETMGTIFNKTNRICIELLLAALEEYEKRVLPSIPQIQGDFPIANNLSQEEMMIDYNNTAKYIEKQIRALNPFLLMGTFFRNDYVKILSAKALDKNYSDKYANGEIVKVSNKELIVKTGKGAILIKALQFGSYVTGSVEDFIAIAKPKRGERFY